MKLEEFQIYKAYIDMLYYTNEIVKKFPKVERYDLVLQIKEVTQDGLKCIIKAYKSFEKQEKNKYLNELDSNLKALKLFIRISNVKKYITFDEYIEWSNVITEVNNLMFGWIKWVNS